MILDFSLESVIGDLDSPIYRIRGGKSHSFQPDIDNHRIFLL